MSLQAYHFSITKLYTTLTSFGFYPRWAKVLESGTPGRPDRVTVVCKKFDSLSNAALERYWLTNHDNHSSGEPAHRFGA